MATKRKSERLICGSCLARVTITNGHGKCQCGREYTLNVGKAKKASSTRKKAGRIFKTSSKWEASVIRVVMWVGTMAVIIIILAKWGG